MNEKNRSIVFIFGLYRSGTTLVSRLLNGDNRFASASDPVRPFFNAYSNFLRHLDGNDSPLFFPIRDGFRDDISYYMRLIESRFSESIPAGYVDKIADQLISQSFQFSPVFSEYIASDLQDKDFPRWRDFLNYLIDSLFSCYGNDDQNALAIKEVWTLELAAPLLKYLQDRVKIIIVLRDPADIFASSKTNAGNYPLMYLSRQWRKNIAIAKYLKCNYNSQVEIVEYEQLCLDPLSTYNSLIRNILPASCNWSVDELPMPRVDKGVPFLKNSSYKSSHNSKFIDTASVGRFRSVLNTSEKSWINYLCNISYLGSLGFPSLVSNSPANTSINPREPYPVRDKSHVADWFNQAFPYYESPRSLDRNLALELDRTNCLQAASSNRCSDNSILNIINQV